MRGKEIIIEAEIGRRANGYKEPQTTHINLVEHSTLLELHARALACHCECLGMNAENSHACCIGATIPYGYDAYDQVMKK